MSLSYFHRKKKFRCSHSPQAPCHDSGFGHSINYEIHVKPTMTLCKKKKKNQKLNTVPSTKHCCEQYENIPLSRMLKMWRQEVALK